MFKKLLLLLLTAGLTHAIRIKNDTPDPVRITYRMVSDAIIPTMVLPNSDIDLTFEITELQASKKGSLVRLPISLESPEAHILLFLNQNNRLDFRIGRLKHAIRVVRLGKRPPTRKPVAARSLLSVNTDGNNSLIAKPHGEENEPLIGIDLLKSLAAQIGSNGQDEETSRSARRVEFTRREIIGGNGTSFTVEPITPYRSRANSVNKERKTNDAGQINSGSWSQYLTFKNAAYVALLAGAVYGGLQLTKKKLGKAKPEAS